MQSGFLNKEIEASLTDRDKTTVPYFMHEFTVYKLHSIIKKLIIVIIVCIALIFASNFMWLSFFNQYDVYSEETVTVDGNEGIANYIGNDGDIVNGEDSSSEN